MSRIIVNVVAVAVLASLYLPPRIRITTSIPKTAICRLESP